MSSKIGLIIASHGDFAKGAVTSLQMIVGGTEDIQVVSVTPTMQLDEVEKEFQEGIEKLGTCDEILICVDLLSGTPCNVASRFYVSSDNIAMLAGFSLPLLLEIMMKINNNEEDMRSILQDIFDLYPKAMTIFQKEG